MTRKCISCGKRKKLETGFYKASYQPAKGVTYRRECKKCEIAKVLERRKRKPDFDEPLEACFARIDSLIARKHGSNTEIRETAAHGFG
jgi:hypothetical protein